MTKKEGAPESERSVETSEKESREVMGGLGGKIEESEREIEAELRKSEKEDRISRKKKREELCKMKGAVNSKVKETTQTERIPDRIGGENREESKGEGRGDTGGDHSLIKRGVQKVPERGGDCKSEEKGIEKPRVSPGIEKMRKIFEKETEAGENKIETVSKVHELKSSFELLMNREKREQEASDTKEREKRKKERKERTEQRKKAEAKESRVESIREKFNPKKVTTNTKEEKGQRGTRGKIPRKVNPNEKRKREAEDEESDKENQQERERKRKWGGGSEKSIERGKIRNSEEQEKLKNETETIQTTLSRTLDLGRYKMTELNKCYQPIESSTDRHEVKSEKKVVNLKRNILKEKVQEQKGVGVKMGHCEQNCVKKPERMEEELKNGGKSLEMQPDKSQEIKTVQATFKGVKTLGAKRAICGESQKPCFLAIPNRKN